MKVVLPCFECLRTTGNLHSDPIEVEVVSDGPMTGRCPHGHETPLAIQNQDFELLFDLGCMALLDGYSREAVTSMAASLERACMFYVRCIFSETIHRDKKEGHKVQALEEPFLALTSRQSERQLGAFLALYAINEKEQLPTLAPKWVEFRNDCVHKGRVPTSARVLEYAEAVLTILDQIVAVALGRFPDAVATQTHRHIASRNAGTGNQSTLHLPTIVSLVIKRPAKRPFSERLEELRKWRQEIWFP